MRAVYYLNPGQVEVREIDTPVPQKDEALVKVYYSGICGSDLTIATGKHLTAKPPLILGHEFSGEVVEVNDDFGRGIQRGDHVTVFPLLACHHCHACRTGNEHVCRELGLIGIKTNGGMAEYVSVPLKSLIRLKPEADMRLAALNEPLAVAVHSVRESRVTIGDRVLVLGGGPIGVLLALVLRFAGIHDIVVSEIHPYREKALQELGFRVLDPREDNIAQNSLQRTEQEGADVVFEASGAEGLALTMTDCVRPRGQIMMVSVFKKPVPIDMRQIAYKEINLQGIRVYSRIDFERAARLIAAGEMPLEKVISCEFPLEEATEGFQLLQNHGDALKVLIKCL